MVHLPQNGIPLVLTTTANYVTVVSLSWIGLPKQLQVQGGPRSALGSLDFRSKGTPNTHFGINKIGKLTDPCFSCQIGCAWRVGVATLGPKKWKFMSALSSPIRNAPLASVPGTGPCRRTPRWKSKTSRRAPIWRWVPKASENLQHLACRSSWLKQLNNFSSKVVGFQPLNHNLSKM